MQTRSTINHSKGWFASEEGVVYYFELFLENERLNSDKYCAQLDRLKTAIDKRHPELIRKVVFHKDNAKPYISLQIRQKLLQFGWDILPYLSHSSDLTPSDYYLFRSLQNSLNNKKFSKHL